ncbi:MFS transporter [Pseudomonas coronafaciens pv. porri]|uniref:MFS transporter n=1 Tax=Pseudomonas coronafaciens pv. porri TaxID=83964 RepID=A0ABR5JNY4_9PSED|nr:MFS transporter [Pseudomonas coronafaciens]KOP55745.1 MFS transporter [Pseudomonas coronafaciens pv. porri]KOP59193.1 MFS transporter [Pseudomonas coronafaciens pv. porri]KPY18861.1 Major facilitator transporter [Pseudomonas coronafaciens pv. porri]RMU81753.1 Major facilitator transporter [Pseudomonas coronafaciens pv. porri]RMW04542.1 Major facilitator transporter [Pseudomonas coronafaciens pv. porri]
MPRVIHMQTNAEPQGSDAGFEDRTYRKVILRTLPILLLCYMAAYLDRVNIGFAKLDMLNDLQFSNTVYALGASMFFWGYFLFEVPSNLLLHRLGARFWIARIMFTWALVSIAVAFTVPLAQFFRIESSSMFYVLRFLLGICEAGFFPGVILYLNYWFPTHRQSRVMSGFLMALPVSLTLGGMLSGWLMNSMNGIHGMAGWQWMLIIEGIPSIIMTVVVIVYLCDNIDSAKWLSAPEKAMLKANLVSDNHGKASRLSDVFFNPRVWLLVLILLTFNTGFYGLAFWMPSIIKSAGIANTFHIGLLTAIPYSIATVAMLLNARHSNRTGERRLHAAVPAFIGGVGLILSAYFAHNLVLSVLFLSVAASGLLSLMPIFWTLPGTVLSGVAAAAGIGMINAIGNLSGFTGSMITAVAETMTGDINNGTYVLALCLLVSGGLILLIPRSMLDKTGAAPVMVTPTLSGMEKV